MSQVGQDVGTRLRQLRARGGLSLSELARRSGVGKATLSELEAGRRNPTLETLFALTTALGEPLSAALPPAAPQRPPAPDAVDDVVDAWLLESSTGVEVYRLRVRAGPGRVSSPHTAGVREQVLVVSGTLRCGPAAGDEATGDGPAPEALGGRVLAAGESTEYPGDVAHTWQACGGQDVTAVLVMRYDAPPGGAREA
ncbi:XRE family transcriptional regulator [Pseudokineococcus sp. 1T1Z-3]|uniref:XRE family transcriptional regulator n=1 Tax=Pseudokineococcus sp. 1T1Z-3 TaxID=3132745 RepID=UPI0030B760CD